MQQQLGEDYPAFETALQATGPTSIRLHPQKADPSQDRGTSVPWCSLGRYLEERPVFTLDPLYHAGCYYVQEASSMILGAFFPTIERQEGPLTILDLCAAPGGKTTHLLSLMGAADMLVANEIHPQRNSILFENLTRWGDSRAMIARCPPDQLAAAHPERFDILLVDAPCSGEGMFRKDPFAVKQWTPELVIQCADRQQQILDAAMRLLKPDGTLIYSTCTYNREENEDQIARLIEQYGVRLTLPDLDARWGIVRSDLGYRCYPHLMQGEGLFMSMVQKRSSAGSQEVNSFRPQASNRHTGTRQKAPADVQAWLRDDIELDFYLTRQEQWKAIPVAQVQANADLMNSPLDIQAGLQVGKYKTRTLFIPDHALALSTDRHPDVPAIALEEDDALRFLKKESIAAHSTQSGIRLVTFQGYGLGWGKLVPGRMNNLLPHHWRIRMTIPD